MNDKKPAIIVISSHVARGTVGNRAAGFALEVLGFPVWIVPTVTLPWHPGHFVTAGAGHRIVPRIEDFTSTLEDLAGSPWIGEVGAVLSGYLGEAAQAQPVADLVGAVKAKNPNAIYALDPVTGDNGRLYVPQEQAKAIRDILRPLADVTKPNPFELGLLAQAEEISSNEDLVKAARSLTAQTVLVTSAFGMMKGTIANLLVQGSSVNLAEHRLVDGPLNGLGDLTAALFLGNMMQLGDANKALQKTSASVYEAMSVAAHFGSDELKLENSLGSLLKPKTVVESRKLLVRS